MKGKLYKIRTLLSDEFVKSIILNENFNQCYGEMEYKVKEHKLSDIEIEQFLHIMYQGDDEYSLYIKEVW